MSLEAFARDLITSQDPLLAIFDRLREVWKPTEAMDIDEFYMARERETNAVEDFIIRSFYEAYDLLLAAIRRAEASPRFKPDDDKVVFMDGLSIREAGFLALSLEKQGYRVEEESTFTLSHIPSTTQSFLKQYFGVSSLSSLKKWGNYTIAYVSSGEVPKLLPEQEKCIIWISFPDELIHHARGKVNTPKETLTKTWATLQKVLERLNPDRFLLTSDHGYMYAKSATLFLKAHKADERVLKRVFGAKRGLAPVEPSPELEQLRRISKDRSYVTFDEKGCYLRGRFYWSLPGRQADISHGGLSFMECLIPSMRIRRS